MKYPGGRIGNTSRLAKAQRTYSRLCLFTTRLNCRKQIGSRQLCVCMLCMYFIWQNPFRLHMIIKSIKKTGISGFKPMITQESITILISTVVQRTCDTFNINSIPTNDANDISNAFCSYFTNIGQQCASTIGQATSHSSNYLKGNYQNSFFLIPTTPGDIITIISSFKSKASSGHDGLSSKLVKDLKYALAFPLSIITNNSLAKGLVPNMAKLAKIIPIYKAKDKKNMSNYRPISLLPVISKIHCTRKSCS